MSEFLSVRAVVFGSRNGLVERDKSGEIKITHREREKPVDIASVVSAIELSETYYFDDYGRFCMANDEAKIKIKQVLAKYHTLNLGDEHGELMEPFLNNPRVIPGYSSPEAVRLWESFGWPEDKLPDFEACYKQWQTDNGMVGEFVPPLQRKSRDPFPQNHVWNLMSQILKLTVGEEAHQVIKKGICKDSISILETKGLRWAENEKPALRRHLKAIVANAQQ